MIVFPPESREDTIKASRLYSPTISHRANKPGSSSLLISALMMHSGSLNASTYVTRTYEACFANGLASGSAFCDSVEACVCVLGTVLVVREVRRRASARASSVDKGWEAESHDGNVSVTILLCFAPSCGRILRVSIISWQRMRLRWGRVWTRRSRRNRTRAPMMAIMWWKIGKTVMMSCSEEPESIL